MVNYELIGKRIRDVREKKCISQAKLAELSDLSNSYINRIEKAKKKPSLNSVISIVNALGITVDELLYGNQTFKPTEYQSEIASVISDCSSREKRILYETVKSIKQIMRENDKL